MLFDYCGCIAELIGERVSRETDWDAASDGAKSGSQVMFSFTGSVEFDHWALCSAATDGSVRVSGALPDSESFSNNGEEYKLTITLSD